MTSWQRTEWLDCYAEDGEAVVMLASGEVTALSPLAWAAAESIGDKPVAESAIIARLVETFGAPEPPASAEQLTREVLGSLAQAGLLARVTRTS